ncbi:hypothetical protein [Rhizobacter sp. Root1221]|uniref:hypothetical protein n=1 Tax=Rhizobacter sp. Root1221 TaxID=1736433 RepID=UPI000712E85C|nr:hypothetical protein [Rhizobacter sp. Root1221]KQV85486.1 hypothetical protein ASC87_07290 [Rhizobacter sp. Root1221]
MPDSARPELTLLIQNVPDTERTKAAAFLRVGSDRLECDWALVSSGDVDVLLHGGDGPDTIPGLLDEPVATLRLVDASENTPAKRNALARPLQFEDFMNALAAAEGKIMGPAVKMAPTPVPPRAPVAVAALVAVAAVAAPIAVAAPVAVKAPAVAVQATSFMLESRGAYRLRRWPPSRLLLGHRYHARLSGFMSVRHVGLDELARLSNVSIADCQSFLVALGTEGLLDVKVVPAPVSLPSPPPRAAAPCPGQRPEIGLFGKLRRRLGLDASK